MKFKPEQGRTASWREAGHRVLWLLLFLPWIILYAMLGEPFE